MYKKFSLIAKHSEKGIKDILLIHCREEKQKNKVSKQKKMLLISKVAIVLSRLNTPFTAVIKRAEAAIFQSLLRLTKR